MKLKDKISREEVCGKVYKFRSEETSNQGNAAFTHYLHNHQNGVSQFYKNEAIQHVKRALEYKFPNENISPTEAEEALQFILFDLKKDIPFPEPAKRDRLFVRSVTWRIPINVTIPIPVDHATSSVMNS